jgi:DNA-binding MarR family transcriptional regulator
MKTNGDATSDALVGTGTSVKRTEDGQAVTDLILATFLANGRLLKAGDALSRDLGLTSARWQVLGALEDGPKTVSQIARRYELTRQGILWVVRSMTKDGLVILIKNPDHKRAKLVQYSPSGRAIYEEINRRQAAWANEIGKALKGCDMKGAIKTIELLGSLAMGDD